MSKLMKTTLIALAGLLMGSLLTPVSAQARLIKDIAAGSGSANPTGIFRWGDELYFSAWTATHGVELHKTDGTAKGTVLVADVQVGGSSSYPKIVGVSQGWLIFSAVNTGLGRELYATKGLSFTPLLEINKGSNGCDPRPLLDHRGKLYFQASYSGSGLSAKKTVFYCEGTKWSRFSTAYSARWKGPEVTMHAYGDKVLLERRGQLWVTSSGTGTGIQQIYNSISSAALSPCVDSKWIYFNGHDGSKGYQLFRSDGTYTNTRLWKVLNPTGSSTPHSIIPSAGGVFCIAYSAATGTEPMWTDGSKQLIFDIYPGTKSSAPHRPRLFGPGRLLFSATEPLAGDELWMVDVTNKASHIDVLKGASSSVPSLYAATGSRYAYFAASDSTKDREVWRTDGTQAGTKRVVDICASCSSVPGEGFQLGGNLIVPAYDKQYGNELWAIPLEGVTDPIGKPSGPQAPALVVSDPVLDKPLTFEMRSPGISSTTPYATLVLLAGQAQPPYINWAGVQLFIDLNNILIALPILATGPTLNAKLGKIPNNPKLIGASLLMQNLVFGLPKVSATKGMRMHLGR